MTDVLPALPAVITDASVGFGKVPASTPPASPVGGAPDAVPVMLPFIGDVNVLVPFIVSTPELWTTVESLAGTPEKAPVISTAPPKVKVLELLLLTPVQPDEGKHGLDEAKVKIGNKINAKNNFFMTEPHNSTLNLYFWFR